MIHEMKRIVIHNRKGGTGKSILSAHIAFALETKFRVLLLDLDQQGNTTSVNKRPLTAFGASKLFEGVVPVPKIGVGEMRVCASDRAALASVVDNRLPHAEILRNYINNLDAMAGEVDFLIVDTSPGNTILERAALAGASHVVIPLEPTELAIAGAREVVGFCKQISTQSNHPIEKLSAVMNRMSSVSARQRKILVDIIMLFGGAFVEQPLKERDLYKVAHEAGVPVWSYKASNDTAKSAISDMQAVVEAITKDYV